MCGWVKGNFQCTNLMLTHEVHSLSCYDLVVHQLAVL